jgi:uncharacterized protein
MGSSGCLDCMRLSRRALLRTAGLASLGAGLYTWRVEPHWLEFTERRLPVRGLPADLAGKTLVQLTDLHVGPRVSDTFILDTFEGVRKRRPDFVVFTGDFTSYSADVVVRSERVYRRVPLGRKATLGILGNHDYGPNWSHPEVALAIAGMLQNHGVTILRNQVLEFGGLQFVGLDDLWANQFLPAEAFREYDPASAAIALSHNPDTVDLDGWAPFEGWILSGHTHGGQCKPPFLPPPLLPVKNRTYTAGAFSLPASRTMFISRGVGHLLEVRFNVRPEVPVFTMVRA